MGMMAGYKTFFEQDPIVKEEEMKNLLEKTVPEGLGRLEKCLASRGGQFFAGNALTWAELHFIQLVDLAVFMTKNDQLLDPFPCLASLNTRVRAVPNIARRLLERPANDF